MAFITKSLEDSKSPVIEKLLPWIVCIAGGLLFFYEFIQMNMFNSLSAPLMASFHVDATRIGTVSSIYFWTNASLLFVAGNLLDRFSTRKLILLAMLFCTLGTIGFAISPTLVIAGICRFFVGIGGAFCFLGGVKLASRWFPPKRMGLIIGVIVTMAMFGGMVGQAPLTLLIEKFGWRYAIFLDGLLGVVLTMVMWFIIKDRPEKEMHLETEETEKLEAIGLKHSIKWVLSNPNNWYAAFYTSLMNLPIFLVGGFLGSMYLHQMDGLTVARAAAASGMVFTGTIFGSPLAGIISDKMGRRCLPMYVGAVISFLIVIPLIYMGNLSYGELLIMFFLLGLTTSSQVISYAAVAEHNEHVLTGTAVSIVSMITVYGGAFLMPFAGWLLDSSKHKTMINGVPHYSLLAYQHTMLIMPIAFIAALVCALLLKETYCKPVIKTI